MMKQNSLNESTVVDKVDNLTYIDGVMHISFDEHTVRMSLFQAVNSGGQFYLEDSKLQCVVVDKIIMTRAVAKLLAENLLEVADADVT